MLQAGKLNQRIELQRRVTGRDGAGQPSTTWELVAPMWADVRNQGGLEAIKAGATTSVVQSSIRIRYRAGVDSGMRVLYDGRTYNILAVLPDARRVHIDLVCEVVA